MNAIQGLLPVLERYLSHPDINHHSFDHLSTLRKCTMNKNHFNSFRPLANQKRNKGRIYADLNLPCIHMLNRNLHIKIISNEI